VNGWVNFGYIETESYEFERDAYEATLETLIGNHRGPDLVRFKYLTREIHEYVVQECTVQ
jgi:hypothetical protein